MSRTTLRKIVVPARVWDDYLDPDTTTMQRELGLSSTPVYRRRGRGGQYTYRDVSREVAGELAGYLEDRAGTLLCQSYEDPAERRPHHRALRLARDIRKQLRIGG
jgi:hypothetical protein